MSDAVCVVSGFILGLYAGWFFTQQHWLNVRGVEMREMRRRIAELERWNPLHELDADQPGTIRPTPRPLPPRKIPPPIP